jgi:cyclopropane fatty-acyl-phospholipid synthase-like methyltransferase
MDNQIKTIQFYNQFVKEYEHKFMFFDLYNGTFDEFLNILPAAGSMLELGCGPGNVIKYFSDKRPDLQLTGVDLAPAMLKRAQEINPTANFILQDIRNLNEFTKPYDAIIGAFCLPYLSSLDLPKFFAEISRLTKENGYVYLSCMEGESNKSGFEKTSFTGDSELDIYYHERLQLEKLLLDTGFQTEKFYTKDYPETDGTITTDLIYIIKKIKK